MHPLTLDSTFWIASCTKLLTTIACLQGVERDFFSLDSPDDIARFLSEIASPDILTGFDAEGKPITVPAKKRFMLRQLLTHTSGMSYEFWTLDWLLGGRLPRTAAHSTINS